MTYRLQYSDYPGTSGPPDPARWVGPPGPRGPAGPVGPAGTLSNASSIAVGNGTGSPTLTLNGAASTAKGIQWQTASTNRWLLQTDASDNLALNAYDAAGTWFGTAIQFANNASSIVTNFPVIAHATNATVLQGVTGLFHTATNSGSHAAQGTKFAYFSASGAGDGFDTGMTSLAIFDPASFAGGPIPFYQSMWGVAVSPNDTAHNWNCIVGEFNVTNRGADKGWKRDRSTANPTGGFLLVPETNTFGGTGGGEGKNATFAYSVGHSGGNNSTGFPAKWYNGLLVEPDSIVGQTGRAIYLTGDVLGTASQYPYGPLQTDGTWLHGIDHTLATYTDSHAQTMAIGQGVAWITGTTATPTASASINASGSGSDISLSLNPAGAGAVSVTGYQPLQVINALSTSGYTNMLLLQETAMAAGGACVFRLGRDFSTLYNSGYLYYQLAATAVQSTLRLGMYGTTLDHIIMRGDGAVLVPNLPGSTTYANDGAAATGGVAVGQLYRNGSAVMVRVT